MACHPAPMLVLLYHMANWNIAQARGTEDSSTSVSTIAAAEEASMWDAIDDLTPSSGTTPHTHLNSSSLAHSSVAQISQLPGLRTNRTTLDPTLVTTAINLPKSTSRILYSTTSPSPSTKRPFYYRGVLVKTHDKAEHPNTGVSGKLKPASVLHREWLNSMRNGTESECWPQCGNDSLADGQGTGNNLNGKHLSSDRTLYNTNIFHDMGGGASKSSHFFTWIFASGMVAAGSLVALGASFLFCYCADKVRKRREETRRRNFDKSGEYERVDSVSSIVSHNNVYDENADLPVDDITII